MNVPDGAERYDPSSTAWVNIFKETKAKKQKQADSKAARKATNDAQVKDKKSAKPTKSKPIGEKFKSKMNNFNHYVCLRLFNEITELNLLKRNFIFFLV